MLFYFQKLLSHLMSRNENGVLFLSLRHDVLGKETIQSVLPRGADTRTCRVSYFPVCTVQTVSISHSQLIL